MSININTDLCCGDSLCVKVCPANCLSVTDGKVKNSNAARFTCIACGQCIAVCPKDALSLDIDKVSEIGEKISSKMDITKEQFEILAKTRRSIRNYKDKEVSLETMKEALELACFAPTAKNGQNTEWIFINNKEKIRELAGIIIDYMRTVPSLKRMVQHFDAGGDPIFRNAPCLVFSHCPTEVGNHYGEIDCTIATTYLELFLPCLELGACWAGFAMSISKLYPPVNEFLNIPKEHSIYTGLMIGYPSTKYKKIPPRKHLRLQIID